jgi:hypothetical protein
MIQASRRRRPITRDEDGGRSPCRLCCAARCLARLVEPGDEARIRYGGDGAGGGSASRR